MSTNAYALSDSMTMLRRDLRHMRRYPGLTVMLVAMPVIFLLLFVYVFGDTMGAGLGASGDRGDYLAYVVPGMILMTIASVAQGTAISVAMDMNEGIIARFRTMAIFRPAVLAGHVLGSMIQTALSLAVVIGVAYLIGFRPAAEPIEWFGAIGLLAMVTMAMTWLCVTLGLRAKSVETASNTPLPLLLLPFLSSGFVPAATMTVGLRWFAENQPFTPITETLRGLLVGAPIGHNAMVAVAWCVGITAVCFHFARRAYDRDPKHSVPS